MHQGNNASLDHVFCPISSKFQLIIFAIPVAINFACDFKSLARLCIPIDYAH